MNKNQGMKQSKKDKYNTIYPKIAELAKKHKWRMLASDPTVGRISLTDSTDAITLNYYASKQTLSFLSKECKPKYYKKISLSGIENVMLNAYSILWEQIKL